MSYSLYLDSVAPYFRETVGEWWNEMRREAMRILQEEAELEEIVRLVGIDALSARERVTLETAKSIREDYLHQNATHEVDTYSSLQKQFRMLDLILSFHHESLRALDKGLLEFDLDKLFALPVRERIARAKYVPEEKLAVLDEIKASIKEQVSELIGEGGEEDA